MKFYKCPHCGNIIVYAQNMGVPVFCCGEKMQEVTEGVGAPEKHIPVISQEGNMVKVSVGEVAHPMTPEHHIAWVVLETENGFQLKNIKNAEVAEAVFAISEGEKVVAAYSYCNLHGLWRSK